MTVLGAAAMLRVVTCPGFAFTVSLKPVSSGGGAISPPFRNGVSVETPSCGTPFGPALAAT